MKKITERQQTYNKISNTLACMSNKQLEQMLADGASSVTEVGPGKVLQGLFKKVDRELETFSA